MQRALTIFLIILFLLQSIAALGASPENVYEPQIYQGPVIESATPWYQQWWVWVLLAAIIGGAALAGGVGGSSTEGGVATFGGGSGENNGGTVIFRGPGVQ